MYQIWIKFVDFFFFFSKILSKTLSSITYKNVFSPSQVFVANPNKSQPIIDILLKNQTKLIDFLNNFQKDRTDDEQFNDEKTYLIKQIKDLKKPAS